HLAFLPDVARLEWAMNAALHADDAEPLDPGRLAAVAAADLPRVVVALDPSVSLLASAWPVDRIWRAHQDDREPDVDVSAGGVQLEIRRVDDGVTMRSLDAATYALRRALALGRTLEDAAAEAVTVQPAFDLAQAIRELLDERIAVDVAVSN